MGGENADGVTIGTESTGRVVVVGSRVRIRCVEEPGDEFEATRVSGGGTVTIVAPGDGGLYRLSTRTPLARALLGHCAGDVVSASVEARTIHFEVVAVENGSSGDAATWSHG
jgi:transcription elongation GreA/GreB family factor